MVPQGRDRIACCIHHGDGIRPGGQVHAGIALAEISGICQDHFRSQLFKCFPERDDLRVALDGSVDIVGMQDDHLPCKVRVRDRTDVLRPFLLRPGCPGEAEHEQKDRCKKPNCTNLI